MVLETVVLGKIVTIVWEKINNNKINVIYETQIVLYKKKSNIRRPWKCYSTLILCFKIAYKERTYTYFVLK